MRIVHALLKGAVEAATTVRGSHLLHDLLWAHATPGDGVQHIAVRPVPDGMEATFFLTASSDEAALGRARELLQRARAPIAAQGLTALLPA
ncbi:hypothetical protein [Streptomyces sp. NRRL S-378]|uniref:hypothetical protein n=1 Tax=Streptomyces sp. NRRL S-378 TaxID=1463904 RepID=UPI00055F7124|nr:hypothetical protein [Streptomyces sp. NRRL S-378]